MYSSTLFLTSAQDGVGGQRHAPAALTPGKTRYLLCRRLGWPQGRSGRVQEISPPPGFDLRTVQPVARRYTDWAIPAPPPHTYTNIYIYLFIWFYSFKSLRSHHYSNDTIEIMGLHIILSTTCRRLFTSETCSTNVGNNVPTECVFKHIYLLSYIRHSTIATFQCMTLVL